MTPIVATHYGKLEGARVDGLHVFRGIPYAEPPIGRRRWRAPEPASPWSNVRPALAFGASAPQAARPAGLLGGGGNYTHQSEDCLTLNVWTPGLDDARRPVLVWIHGGGFTIGGANDARYDGSTLARRGDVVVVTLNYRLGALGFLCFDAAADPRAPTPNCGILDQIRALEWVRDEIFHFGGDPKNVTLFGESAGGMSVATLLGAPRAAGLFSRAIAQSGAAHHTQARAVAGEVANAFCEAVGVATDSLDSLWEVPAPEILAAQERVGALDPSGARAMTFSPVVDGDLLPRPPLESIAAGSARRVPLLVGTNLDETKLFSGMSPANATLTETELLERVTARFCEGSAERARRLVDVYRDAREKRGASTTASELWSALYTDHMFRVPAVRLAETQAAQQPATFAYLFTWPSPALGGALGSCHVIEVPFVFGTLCHPLLESFTGKGPEANALAEVVQDAWLAFARTSDPSTPALGRWPPYEAAARATMLLGANCGVEKSPLAAELQAWEGIR